MVQPNGFVSQIAPSCLHLNMMTKKNTHLTMGHVPEPGKRPLARAVVVPRGGRSPERQAPATVVNNVSTSRSSPLRRTEGPSLLNKTKTTNTGAKRLTSFKTKTMMGRPIQRVVAVYPEDPEASHVSSITDMEKALTKLEMRKQIQLENEQGHAKGAPGKPDQKASRPRGIRAKSNVPTKVLELEGGLTLTAPSPITLDRVAIHDYPKGYRQMVEENIKAKEQSQRGVVVKMDALPVPRVKSPSSRRKKAEELHGAFIQGAQLSPGSPPWRERDMHGRMSPVAERVASLLDNTFDDESILDSRVDYRNPVENDFRHGRADERLHAPYSQEDVQHPVPQVSLPYPVNVERNEYLGDDHDRLRERASRKVSFNELRSLLDRLDTRTRPAIQRALADSKVSLYSGRMGSGNSGRNPNMAVADPPSTLGKYHDDRPRTPNYDVPTELHVAGHVRGVAQAAAGWDSSNGQYSPPRCGFSPSQPCQKTPSRPRSPRSRYDRAQSAQRGVQALDHHSHHLAMRRRKSPQRLRSSSPARQTMDIAQFYASQVSGALSNVADHDFCNEHMHLLQRLGTVVNTEAIQRYASPERWASPDRWS